MTGDKPNFSQRSDLSNLELPRGTVIEIEYANELEVGHCQSSVSSCNSQFLPHIREVVRRGVEWSMS